MWFLLLLLFFIPFGRQLQKENEELKQLVTEHRSVLEKIMYKYRRDMQRLILMEKNETKAVHLFNNSLAQVKNFYSSSTKFDVI